MKKLTKSELSILTFLFFTLIPMIDANLSFLNRIGINVTANVIMQIIVDISKILLPFVICGIVWYIFSKINSLNKKTETLLKEHRSVLRLLKDMESYRALNQQVPQIYFEKIANAVISEIE